MTKILVIGAGGVGSVATHKMAMLQDVFSDITLASRREVKCKDIADSVMARVGRQIQTAELDADDTNATCLLYTSPSPRDKRQSRMPSSA